MHADPPARLPQAAPSGETKPGQTPAVPALTEAEKRARSLDALKQRIQFASATERKQAIRKVLELKPEERGDFYPFLVRYATDDPDSTIREACVRVMGDMEYHGGEEAMIRALADSNQDVIRSAVNALAKLKSTAAMPRLQELLEHQDLKVASPLAGEIVRAMGRVEFNGAAAFLLNKLKDGETYPELRSTIALYLGDVKFTEAVDYLIELVKNEEQESSLRAAAANALGKIGDRRAVDPLKEQLAKLRALNLRERTALNRLKIQILAALVRLGDTGVGQEIMASARDDDANVRLRAVNQLAELKIADARPLLEYMKEHDPSTQVKRAASRALDILNGVEPGGAQEEDERPPAQEGRQSP